MREELRLQSGKREEKGSKSSGRGREIKADYVLEGKSEFQYVKEKQELRKLKRNYVLEGKSRMDKFQEYCWKAEEKISNVMKKARKDIESSPKGRL